MQRGREIIGNGRSEETARALLVTLLVFLSIFAQLIVKAERDSAAETPLCEFARLGQQVGNIGLPHSGHPRMASDHCGACMAPVSSPPPQHEVSLSQVAPIVRFITLRLSWTLPPELGRAGKTRSRAPPAIS